MYTGNSVASIRLAGGGIEWSGRIGPLLNQVWEAKMAVTWADVLKGVKARQWTINEAWELIESSASEMGLHPDVHVLYPEQHSDSDKHFLTQRDFKGVEYRDRERHSIFRNSWEAAAAVCTGLNSEAGEAALKLVPNGDVTIRSRSALIGSPQQFERLQIAYQGTVTGVSYFEMKCEFVFLFLIYGQGYLGLKTAYPSTGGKQQPPNGQDVVSQGASAYLYPARS